MRDRVDDAAGCSLGCLLLLPCLPLLIGLALLAGLSAFVRVILSGVGSSLAVSRHLRGRE